MNTVELLNDSNIENLRDLARFHNCQCNQHSKLELMKHIQAALRSRHRFVDQWKGLSGSHKRFLQHIVYDYRERFVVDDLLQRAATAAYDSGARKQASNILAEFKVRGWLFEGMSGGERQMFRMPHDLQHFYVRLLKEELASELVFASEPPEYREEKRWLMEDVRLFLVFVGERGLDLTQSGAIQKRWLQQFMRQCRVAESLQLSGFRFGYGRSHHEYPGRFALLYDFCYAQQWIVETDQRLMLSESGKQMVFAMTGPNLNEEYSQLLLHFWLRTYRRAVPNLAAVVRMIVQLCERWVVASSLIAALRLFVKPYYYDDAEQVLALRILPMMISFGLLRVASGDDTELLVQSTDERFMIR